MENLRKKSDLFLIEEVINNVAIQDQKEFTFWYGDGEIDVYKLYEFFTKKGIYLYFSDESRWKKSEGMIVRIEGNIVSEINVGYMLSLAKTYIIEIAEESGNAGAIIASLHKNVKYFADKNLKLLKKANVEFIHDTRDTAYFFFKNGVVEITKMGIELKAYDDYDHMVWENSIIQMDYTQFPQEQIIEECVFHNFMQDMVMVQDKDHQLEREKALKSIIGYMLHRYKDPAINKAIILMDVYVNGLPNGGSGKTLLSTAIGKLRNQSIVDGKSYDQKRWFRLSTVELGTEVLLFDDIKKDFDLEQVFPLMTTGMHIQRKHKDDYFIPYEKAPKVIITTNYALNGESSSFKRRTYEFEISATYNDRYTPRDKFGKNFFEEWNEKEWMLFYNTMFNCIHVYLENGLVKSEPINMRLSKLMNSTCEEFVDFANHCLGLNIQLNKRELFDKYISAYPEYRHSLKQRTFTQWLRLWADYTKLKVLEGHTGDVRYIVFTEKAEP